MTKQDMGERALVWIHRWLYPPLAKLALSSSTVTRTAVRNLCEDVLEYVQTHEQERVAPERLAYLLAHPHHYALDDGEQDAPLTQRVSGQILPQVEGVLKEIRSGQVVEIGCGNGWVAAYLAGKYPAIQFIAMDLSLPKAVRRQESGNLRFMEGYALDLLEPAELPLDAVYFQSTGIMCLPKEMLAYFQLFQRRKVRWVVLNETTRSYAPIRLNEQHSRSIFLGSRMWKHDYPGLARQCGYEVVVFQSRHWSEVIEPRYNHLRYDTHLVQIVARLREPAVTA